MKEFIATFQLSKTIIFNVEYYTLLTNKKPHFSTSADEFCRSKKDFRRCGQAQEELTKGFRAARQFYKKWDAHHLHELTEEQYNEMVADLDVLKDKYNFMEKMLDEKAKPYNPRFGFWRLVEFSKQEPKWKQKKKEAAGA